MAIRTENVDYAVAGRPYSGVVVWDDASDAKRPGVMVCNTWAGQGNFEVDRCKALAKLGYVAMAADLYGKGRRGSSPEENAALLEPMLDDRRELESRLLGSIESLRQQALVDTSRVAATGYCFGGLCVLDLARSGADVQGVVSFHGLLGRAENARQRAISARVLVLHGWDDPMATPESLQALAEELTAARADWQLHAYGGTVHAFTNPSAKDPDRGTIYSPVADRRSWTAMKNFLEELFADPA